MLGGAWSWIWPGVPPGLFAIIGAAAVLAATTRGPVSSIVLVMELTGRDRSFILPMLIAVVIATVVARTLDERSIYEARFTRSTRCRPCRRRGNPLGSKVAPCACSSSRMTG